MKFTNKEDLDTFTKNHPNLTEKPIQQFSNYSTQTIPSRSWLSDITSTLHLFNVK